ncbi:helix-turn-helix domain-containing protein [Pseudomaricurvus sp. HS19]|uniref:winged helix-turn-helix transcriptional regulator n=1 Tax=Pseudomaricurvus sp. HS19 TaxID=2692626 RepID=UPI00136A48CE|nr:helix-turn-helix domain-containing protein [Pseudomaricurvus sp. HS19]MYM63420.1 transcriptional regulator [Pseudomaricurvus sp. HS19]
MNTPGSLCPTVKALDIVGDKWTLLILRELFFGSYRYNQFQRAMPRISPTVLSKRLKHLENSGLIVRKSAAGQKNVEYRLTKCGRELGPVVDGLARWGLRWARDHMCNADLDAGSFMWDFHRTLKTDELPEGETIFCVILDGVKWWLIAGQEVVDLCNEDPGREVDIYLTGSLPVLAELWMGDSGVGEAIRDKTLLVSGSSHLTRTIARWFPRSSYADVRAERFM